MNIGPEHLSQFLFRNQVLCRSNQTKPSVERLRFQKNEGFEVPFCKQLLVRIKDRNA